MRLVAWNANFNGQRRSLEQNVALLESLKGDILVLSETAPPSAQNPLDAHWTGRGCPGLAVVAPTGLSLTPHDANTGAPTLMAGFAVRDRVSFDLLAIWPVQRKGDPSYHRVLMAALEKYARLLASGRAIMAGDLNSSTQVAAQRHSHARFVAAADGLGLVSAYHEQAGERHGQETVATYRGATRDFHIDYCFISKGLAASATVRVLHDDAWRAHSDHFPVVLDIRDAALAPAL